MSCISAETSTKSSNGAMIMSLIMYLMGIDGNHRQGKRFGTAHLRRAGVASLFGIEHDMV